jgi:hypothetical protein
MSSHREKLESAIMVACREIAPGMTREEHDWTLHNFRIWRTLSNDNRAMVGVFGGPRRSQGTGMGEGHQTGGRQVQRMAPIRPRPPWKTKKDPLMTVGPTTCTDLS